MNFLGTAGLTKKMIGQDVINKQGKIVTIASGCGTNFISNCNETMKARFTSDDITQEEAYKINEEFLASIIADNVESEEVGFPSRERFKEKPFAISYGASKACLLVFMKALSKSSNIVKNDIQVYSRQALDTP